MRRALLAGAIALLAVGSRARAPQAAREAPPPPRDARDVRLERPPERTSLRPAAPEPAPPPETRDSDPVAALHALARHPAPHVVPYLLARLKGERDLRLAAATARVLGKLGDAGTLPALEAELSPADPMRSAHVLRAIHAIAAREGEPERARSLCEAMLASHDVADRKPLLMALADIRGVTFEEIVRQP